jgi:hypothetical protein
MAALFKKTRFDVEQEIMELHSFADMIRTFADRVYDGERVWSQDDIHTTLHGLSNLIEAHSDKMMDTHNRVFELGVYTTDPEILENRRLWQEAVKE